MSFAICFILLICSKIPKKNKENNWDRNIEQKKRKEKKEIRWFFYKLNETLTDIIFKKLPLSLYATFNAKYSLEFNWLIDNIIWTKIKGTKRERKYHYNKLSKQD